MMHRARRFSTLTKGCMDLHRQDPIPNPAVRRLSLYLRQLEDFLRKDRRTVSSKQLGESLRLTDAQVRKTWPTSASSAIPASVIGSRT